MEKRRLLRITTVPISLVTLLNGQLDYFQKNNFEVLAVSSSGMEIEQLKDIGVAHAMVNMTRKITPLRDFISLFKLILLIIKFKPHIVHTHTPKAGLLGMMAAWICRVPVRMHTVAGIPWIDTLGSKRRLLKWVERITYTCSHKIYPNSKKLNQFLLNEFDFQQENLKVLGNGSSNGIDSEHYKRTDTLIDQAKHIRIKYSIPSSEIIFVFVGRIVRDKGIVELVESFIELQKVQRCWLILVGGFEHDLDPIPRATLNIINSHEQIITPGFQMDVRPWIIASNIFVLPSYREGFPNVVLQAACLEVPCIVTDINGCNEIIVNEKSGLLIPTKSVSALVNAMQLLVDKLEQRNLFGSSARQFVIANFERKYIWKELLEEYNSYF